MDAVDLDRLLGARRPPARDEPAVGVTKLGIGPARTVSCHVVAEAKPPQHADSVGMQCDACADLLQCRCLFIDARVDSAPTQCVRGGNSTDSATDNGHPKRVSHQPRSPDAAAPSRRRPEVPGSDRGWRGRPRDCGLRWNHRVKTPGVSRIGRGHSLAR